MMEKVINKGMEMIKRCVTEASKKTNATTEYVTKSIETVAKYSPKAMAIEMFADNFYAGTLLSIAGMALFTKVDRRILKVMFSVSFIGKIIGKKILDKYAEKEAIENMIKSSQEWTIHDWIRVLNIK